MKHNISIPVKSINVWIDKNCNHPVNDNSIAALLKQAQESNQMQVYYGNHLHGHIDAFNGTPLFSNGQRIVTKLEIDNQIVWQRS